jgi:hypothetical protein
MSIYVAQNLFNTNLLICNFYCSRYEPVTIVTKLRIPQNAAIYSNKNSLKNDSFKWDKLIIYKY